VKVDAGILRLFAGLIGANLLAWVLALALFRGNASLLGAAFLAYALGLRHAVDDDHIAAIDNVTRKLMQSGERPIRTGLYFSLGHSAVVWLAAIGIALALATAGPRMDFLRHIGGTAGTVVSALFLFAIAAANIIVLKSIAGAIRRHRRGDTPDAQELDRILAPQGFYTRFLKPVFAMVSKPRHMLLIGFLFGLGFDTASEIGVLGISAAAARNGLPIWSILAFPALFTAGMSLVDTLDSTLMTGAYGWAFMQPTRKLYYNLAVTFLSVVAAFVVGGIEVLAMIPDHARLTPALSGFIGRMSDAMSGLGYSLVAAFAALWLASAVIHRLLSQRSGIGSAV
jgi:high-affinity nickel-transport protein